MTIKTRSKRRREEHDAILEVMKRREPKRCFCFFEGVEHGHSEADEIVGNRKLDSYGVGGEQLALKMRRCRVCGKLYQQQVTMLPDFTW